MEIWQWVLLAVGCYLLLGLWTAGLVGYGNFQATRSYRLRMGPRLRDFINYYDGLFWPTLWIRGLFFITLALCMPNWRMRI